MKYDPRIIISDIRTFRIMSNNKNYLDRLYEAYQYIKKEKLNTEEKFNSKEDILVGLFTYEEITIFDRLKNEEYKKIISESWNTIHEKLEIIIEDKEYGDNLASHGRLGYTPKREELIRKGVFVNALTEEEKIIRDEVLADIYEVVKRNR